MRGRRARQASSGSCRNVGSVRIHGKFHWSSGLVRRLDRGVQTSSTAGLRWWPYNLSSKQADEIHQVLVLAQYLRCHVECLYKRRYIWGLEQGVHAIRTLKCLGLVLPLFANGLVIGLSIIDLTIIDLVSLVCSGLVHYNLGQVSLKVRRSLLGARGSMCCAKSNAGSSLFPTCLNAVKPSSHGSEEKEHVWP